MKNILLSFLCIATITACKKNGTGNSTIPGNKISGKWNIITVTVIPHDSVGNVMNSGAIYTEPPYYFYQFNDDLTWLENLTPDLNPGGESGNYVLHSDTSFTLINVNLPSSPVECKITSLTNTSFVFSHQRPTLYNGVTPGFLEYIFQLRK